MAETGKACPDMCAKALPRDLSRLTRRELYELACSHRISGRSTMGREELIAALAAAEVQPRGAPRKPATTDPHEVPRGLRPGMKRRGFGQTPANPNGSPMTSAQMPTDAVAPLRTPPNEAGKAGPSSPPSSADSPENPSDALPDSYGKTRITLQVRDPYWGHVYWEISPETRADLRKRMGESGFTRAVFLLRIYDVTGRSFDGSNAAGFTDLLVLESAGNWYIHLGKPDHEYVVDIGILTPAGQFLTVARSNQARTPRDLWSSTIDPQWRVAEEVFRELYRLSGGWRTGENSEDPERGS